MSVSSFRPPYLLICLLFLLCTGCASLPPAVDRKAAADRIAHQGRFQKSYITTKTFTLTAYWRYTKPGDTINIYIEGDGVAWISRIWLSDDPTPRTPLVLELADIDPAPNVAYLARPGQYTDTSAPMCSPSYWSDRRFSREVAAAVNEAVDKLRADAQARAIHLIGYSGGAALAALTAAGRRDVISLRTVAGNLDPEAVNRHHNVSPLHQPVNPMDVAPSLKGLPQRHFIGTNDTVIPPAIAHAFVKRAGLETSDVITAVPGATHAKGWRERWKELLALPF